MWQRPAADAGGAAHPFDNVLIWPHDRPPQTHGHAASCLRSRPSGFARMLTRAVRRCGHACMVVCLAAVLGCGSASAADATAASLTGVPPTTPQAWMEDVRATNEARAARGRETAAWAAERERLQAIVAAAAAEGARLDHEAEVANAATAKAGAEIAALGDAGDLDRLRAQLDAGAADERARLKSLGMDLPPGILAVPDAGGDDPFGAVMHALESAEQAAGTVSVDVVPGHLGSDEVAVKVLRIAGACAWWVALAGDQAGTVALDGHGGLDLTPVADDSERMAIRQALAMVEGRRPPDLAVLPVVPFAVAVVPPPSASASASASVSASVSAPAPAGTAP